VFIYMLHMFHIYVATVLSSAAYVLQWFLGVFVSVLDVCFKCFICLQTYAASVASRSFKSRSAVESPSSPSTASP
jgi:hypothetical protein